MIEPNSIASIRKVYHMQSLSEKDMNKDPMQQFAMWWQQAIESKIDEPNAMTLATCTSSGKPSARIVLLKGIKENEFIFFSNYNSRKGKEMEDNPLVSLLFFWKELERQVRIEGPVKKISDEESDEYFSQRPRESQIGAWSSPQSAVIDNRHILQMNYQKYDEQFGTEKIPRPHHWGGFAVMPQSIEFWQGRPGRLHDRLQYTFSENKWIMKRLAP